jgi:integrase
MATDDDEYGSDRLFQRKARGPWYAWVYAVDANGVRRRVKFSTGQLDKEAARRVLRDRQRSTAEAANGLAEDAAGRTVADALEYLLQHSQTKERPDATWRMFGQKAGHLNRVLRTCASCDPMDPSTCTHPSLLLSQLGPHVLKRYVDVRLAEGAARETVRKELTTFNAAMSEAVELGWIRKSTALECRPSFKVTYVPGERWLTRDEYERLLASVDLVVMRAGKDVGGGRKRTEDEVRTSKRPRALNRRLWLAVAVGLGARKGEVESLDWSDVDLVNAVVRNRGTKTTGSDRVTPIPAELVAELSRVPAHERVGLVVGRWGNVGRDLPAACELAGIDRVTPNDLRRTYASWLVNEGAPLKIVASLLGHKSTRMVDLVYGKVADATAAAWVNRTWDADGTTASQTRGAHGAPDSTAPPARAARIRAAPTRNRVSVVPGDGVEPPTRGFSVRIWRLLPP